MTKNISLQQQLQTKLITVRYNKFDLKLLLSAKQDLIFATY